MEKENKVAELAKAIDPSVTIHDFRMVVGDSHTNLIFDIVIPYGVKRSDEDIKDEMSRLVKVIDESFMTVISIDHEYSI